MALEQRLPEEAEELKKRRFQIVNVRAVGPSHRHMSADLERTRSGGP